MEKKWIIAKKQSNDVIDQILINRKIKKSARANFLKPDFDQNLHDPMLLPDIKKALKRIGEAIEKKEKIGIFADYDADGVPGGALLYEALKEKFKLDVFVYIPSRQEGYGLNKNGIDYFKKNNVSLMFTVDLGIREIDNSKYANSLGIDVIITDHHEPGEEIPSVVAVINPKRTDSKYPFRELSGGGVVFKLVQALSKEFGKITNNDLKWMMDLVAITTICDVVPLIDENRVFAKFGLIVLQKTKRVGLKELYAVSKIDLQKINTYTVGFQIGPRLNAPGRIKKAIESFNLLVEKDELKAREMALELDAINRKRQDELDKILKEAQSRIKDEKLFDNKIICLWDKKWSSGLIGLIAGRITEEYSRPCIILEQGENKSKGSARSIEGFNIVEVFESIKENLVVFGGHSKAAGLTVENKQLDKVVSQLTKLANNKLLDEDLVPKIKIDVELCIKDLTLKLVDQLKQLEPFGLANQRPLFMIKNAPIEGLKLIGKEMNHLKFKVSQADVVGFNFSEIFPKLNAAQSVDIVFSLDEDTWSERKVQLKLVDLKITD